MTMPAVMRHIRYAEHWLRWARADYRRGDTNAAVLRLLLAEAEIRHAREAGASMTEMSCVVMPRPRRGVALAGAGAALLLILAYTALRQNDGWNTAEVRPVASADQGISAAPVSLGPVQLQSGGFLVLVPSPGEDGPATVPQAAGAWGIRTGRGERFTDLMPLSEDPVPSSDQPAKSPTVAPVDGTAGPTTPGDPAKPATSF